MFYITQNMYFCVIVFSLFSHFWLFVFFRLLEKNLLKNLKSFFNSIFFLKKGTNFFQNYQKHNKVWHIFYWKYFLIFYYILTYYFKFLKIFSKIRGKCYKNYRKNKNIFNKKKSKIFLFIFFQIFLQKKTQFE